MNPEEWLMNTDNFMKLIIETLFFPVKCINV